MITFKIIANGLVENDISFELKDGSLEVEDCTVTIEYNGLYYVRLIGIGNGQGLAVKSPFAVLNFLIAYSRLVKDNKSIDITDFLKQGAEQ